jgi:molybdopterin converting factor small subunit
MLLFAGLRERAGRDELVLDGLPVGATVEQAIAQARGIVPGLDSVAFAVARNRRLLPAADGRREALAEGDELALLPPVSGG